MRNVDIKSWSNRITQSDAIDIPSKQSDKILILLENRCTKVNNPLEHRA
jgi:hypothetical protein